MERRVTGGPSAPRHAFGFYPEEVEAELKQRFPSAAGFYDPLQVAYYDPDHSEEEDREILIAHSDHQKLLLVVYTLRGEAIRIISARRLTPKETQDYERGI